MTQSRASALCSVGTSR